MSREPFFSILNYLEDKFSEHFDISESIFGRIFFIYSTLCTKDNYRSILNDFEFK